MSWVSAGEKGVVPGKGAACPEVSGLERVSEKEADRLGVKSPGEGGHPGPQDAEAGRCPLGPALLMPCLDTSQSINRSFVASLSYHGDS